MTSPAGPTVRIVIGCDTGGTFTDLVLARPGGVRTWKVPSTPDDFSRGVLEGVRRLLAEAGTGTGVEAGDVELVHSSTVATNALLEGKGAPTALVTTRGFRDVLAIRRQARPVLYTLRVRVPPPLLPDRRRIEVAERIGADGAVLAPLEVADVERALDRAQASGARSLAVCLLFSFLTPEHERAIGAAGRARGLAVSLSSDVAPEFREYERTTTTVAQALVAPIVERYVRRLVDAASSLGVRRLRIVHSNGGSLSAEAAAERAAQTLLSGPAAGALGALAVARQALGASPRIVTFDMGGTSTDVSLIDGALGRTTEGAVGGIPIRLPMIDIHTVGAGGGSVAWVDAGGALRVGPKSAGADPGPACYGKGSGVTVTDADLVLGRIVPDRFLGGRMPLDLDAARRAIDRLAQQASASPESAAEGVLEVVDGNMERAIRVISVQRGHDPRDFTLCSFGGAGGLHACAIAEALSMRAVLVPRDPGVLSAWGAATSDVVKEYGRTILRQGVARDAGSALAELGALAEAEMAREGLAAGTLVLERLVDARYRGQSYELTVPFADEAGTVERAFHEAHQRRYGHAAPGEPVEIVTVRLRAVGAVVTPPAREIQSGRSSTALVERRGERAVYDRAVLGAGATLEGPALIVEPYATTLVPLGWSAEVDRWGHLHLARVR